MVGALAMLAIALAPRSAHPCLRPQPPGPAVPAPIVLHTSCGWYEHDPNGRTFRLPNHWGAIHGAGSGRRYGAQLDVCCDEMRHISLRLHGRLVWRSRRAYPGYGGELAFGPHELAFADEYRGVFLTDLRTPERLVLRGRGLLPYDFTRSGDLIVVDRGSVVVISRAGRLVGRYRTRAPGALDFDWRADTLYFVTPAGRLVALRDRRVRLGARVRGLATIRVLARGVVAAIGTRSFAVFRDGRRRIAVAGWDPRVNALVAGPEQSPDGGSFVYELARAGRTWGSAALLVVRRGDRRGRLLLRGWRSPTRCFEGACAGGFDWSGRFFLYRPGDGHLGIVDSVSGRLIDLTRFDLSLPHLGPRAERATVAWKSDFPR